MRLNNKGFAITGILYTVFILFLLITVAVLAGLQSRKTMLEKSTMKLEESYEGIEQNNVFIDNFNTKKSNIAPAPVTGKYEFYITNNFFKEVETPQNFEYTGKVQTFTTKKPGYYKIELWGAQGGKGGKGGYTAGFLNITEEDINNGEDKEYKLYVYVGGEGKKEETTTNEGGWNGGGASGNNDASNSYGGGGATDVRLKKASETDEAEWNEVKSLRSRIMVAGGGGGGFTSKSGSYTQNPGVGGNLTGGTGISSYDNLTSGGGTQTSGGTGLNNDKKGLFGKATQTKINGWGGGGGGGYWGGAMGNGKPGGGGSSYISGYLGSVAIESEASEKPRKGNSGQQCTDGTTDIKCSYHYSGKIFSNAVMIDGSSVIPRHDGEGNMEGNGYARITYYGQSISNVGTQYLYGYTGNYREFKAEEEGIYKIELWGAQGGGVNAEAIGLSKNYGGKGAYTTGRIELEKDEKLYIYVGNYGYAPDNLNTPFNGGGAPDTKNTKWLRSHLGEFSGGGATDIRFFGKNKVPTTDELKWDSEIGLASRIMVAAGGGGGNNGDGSSGGVGGTLNGGITYDNNDKTKPVSTPTQITGNKFGIGQESGLYPNNHGADTGAGGGGYWGGYRGLSTASGGSGGSSYISGHKNCIAIKSANDTSPRNDSNGKTCIENSDDVECSKHYSGKTFTDTAMYDGNNIYMPIPVGIGIMTGNAGNGFAKITYLGKKGEVPKTDITCAAYIKKGVDISKKANLKFTTKECNDVKYSFVFEKESENDNVMALARIYSFEE